MAFMVFVDGTGNELTAAQVNTYLMKQVVVACTSGTRPSSPPEGMCIYETDTNTFKIWEGSIWRRYAVDLEDHIPEQVTQNDSQTGITSTTWTAGSPDCKLNFNAPPSGYVLVTVSGLVQIANNAEDIALGWELRTGSTAGAGTEIWAPSHYRSVSAGKGVVSLGPAYTGGSYGPYLVSGLTPGSAYHVRTKHRVTGGTGVVEARHILIQPVH